MLICPICKENLEKNEKTYSCLNGHSFDVAKQGYINLLLSQTSGVKGDDKDMLLARKEFLNGNHYEKIAEKMVEIIKSYKSDSFSLADIGCGEGYYTSYMKKHIDNSNNVLGLDISKDGIRYAAGRDKNITWLVASGLEIPIKDLSFNFVTSMFTRTFDEEFARILQEEGILVIVNSSKNHLIELREIIYEEVLHKEKIEVLTLENFHYINREKLNYSINVNNKELINLLEMTPHKWKVKPENRKKLESLENLDLTVDVYFDIYMKK